jgi:hypothetical protein
LPSSGPGEESLHRTTLGQLVDRTEPKEGDEDGEEIGARVAGRGVAMGIE